MIRELSGYRGETQKILRNLKISIGDLIRVSKEGQIYEGLLIPRYELADDKHIVIKLKNGYNIGIKISPNIALSKVGKGEKPLFKRLNIPSTKRDLPTVSIISTGGTIASRVDYRTGAVHSALSANDLAGVVPELFEIANIKTEILFSLFSENLRTSHWEKLATSVAKHITDGVDGIVICHGTDTMAYTSAALSFALQNLPIPVIVVGSQRSSDRPSSDAAQNLINAVRAAAACPIAEVMVCMHGVTSDTGTLLHRGTKVRKCHTSRRDAFTSVNSNPLARIDEKKIQILANHYAMRDPKKNVVLKPAFEEKVALIKFYPGLPSKIIRWFVDNQYVGFVFEGTGLGHLAEYLFSEIKYAIERGLVVALTSQCIWGRVNMNVYATGMDLQKIGVIPLRDMLSETAIVKLMWAYGQTHDTTKVKKILESNIAGEMAEKSTFRDDFLFKGE